MYRDCDKEKFLTRDSLVSLQSYLPIRQPKKHWYSDSATQVKGEGKRWLKADSAGMYVGGLVSTKTKL